MRWRILMYFWSFFAWFFSFVVAANNDCDIFDLLLAIKTGGMITTFFPAKKQGPFCCKPLRAATYMWHHITTSCDVVADHDLDLIIFCPLLLFEQLLVGLLCCFLIIINKYSNDDHDIAYCCRCDWAARARTSDEAPRSSLHMFSWSHTIPGRTDPNESASLEDDVLGGTTKRTSSMAGGQTFIKFSTFRSL